MSTLKSIIKHSISWWVFAAIMGLTNCGSDGPSANEVATKKITAGSWILISATVDGVDKTATYFGMGLSFTASSYMAVNGQPVWPNSGSWAFSGSDGKSITRSDGLAVTIQELTDTSLKLGLIWSTKTVGPGRLNSVAGNHSFSFVR